MGVCGRLHSRQFDDATNRTIELIDMLWLQGDAIIDAFEVEHTTAIYSWLLRTYLVNMQPNIKIDLFKVAPDPRREKVAYEINRPTFARLKPPLSKICRLRPCTQAAAGGWSRLGGAIHYMKPVFVFWIAEYASSRTAVLATGQDSCDKS